MPRKNSGQSSAKKHTAVPPKTNVADAAKPVAATPEAIKLSIPAATPAAAPAPAAPAVVVAPAPVAAPAKVAVPAVAEVKQSACPVEAVKATPAVETPASVAIVAPAQDQALAALVPALYDADADIARDAATSIAALGSAAAVMPLIDVLANRNGYFHCVVRAAAAMGLGRLGDARSIEPLLSAITDSTAEVSVEAIHALGALGDASAVPALIDVVRNRVGYFLPVARRAAVLSLARLGGEQATHELRHVAADSWENAVVREAAEAALRASTDTE